MPGEHSDDNIQMAEGSMILKLEIEVWTEYLILFLKTSVRQIQDYCEPSINCKVIVIKHFYKSNIRICILFFQFPPPPS